METMLLSYSAKDRTQGTIHKVDSGVWSLQIKIGRENQETMRHRIVPSVHLSNQNTPAVSPET